MTLDEHLTAIRKADRIHGDCQRPLKVLQAELAANAALKTETKERLGKLRLILKSRPMDFATAIQVKYLQDALQ